MQRFLKFAVAALAITTAVAAFAADNSLGTWKLNVQKSKSSAGAFPLKNLTVTREADGDGVKATYTGERTDGKSINASYTTKSDGSPATVSGEGTPYDSVSSKQVNANTYTWDAKSSTTKYHSQGRLTVSADGKTMTLKAKGRDPEGKPLSATLVWEKQ